MGRRVLMHIIPTNPALPHWSQETEIDGLIYQLSFRWNERDSAWYFELRTSDGEVIRSGVRMVPNAPLLRKVRHPRRPPGEIMVVSIGAVTRSNLGHEARLVYFSLDDLAEAGGG